MLHDNLAESVAAFHVALVAAGGKGDNAPFAPQVGLVLGSGLGDVASFIEDAIVVPYTSVPHMCDCTNTGHEGCFVCGHLRGKQVICMQGRLHMYEGYSAQQVAYPIQFMRALGATVVLMTNATGAINLDYEVGQLVLVCDHINLTGRNPLVGECDKLVGPRFNDMCTAYSPRLRELAHTVAGHEGFSLTEGVYVGVLGPSLETPAEIRAFRVLGADVVGMSTVPEVIAAVNCGLEVAVISFVSNMAAGILDTPIMMQDIYAAAKRAGVQIEGLIGGMVEQL